MLIGQCNRRLLMLWSMYVRYIPTWGHYSVYHQRRVDKICQFYKVFTNEQYSIVFFFVSSLIMPQACVRHTAGRTYLLVIIDGIFKMVLLSPIHFAGKCQDDEMTKSKKHF